MSLFSVDEICKGCAHAKFVVLAHPEQRVVVTDCRVKAQQIDLDYVRGTCRQEKRDVHD